MTRRLTVMPKVIECYRKPEKRLKADLSIGKRRRIEQKVIILETSKTNDQNDQLDENTPEDERKSEVLGAQSELKSRKRFFLYLLSSDSIRVYEPGI